MQLNIKNIDYYYENQRFSKIKTRVKNAHYENVKILENINFLAEKGNFIGIIGPNGSGKSTLLKCISRILKPKKGVILLDNEELHSMKSKEVAKVLAAVSQNTTITFSFTAFEVVLMGRTPHLRRFESEGKSDINIAKEAMELTDTTQFADRYFTELSGGEQQRVIIAKALVQKPEILLLDEPISNLDIHHQYNILNLIKKLSIEQDLTVIIVLHDLNIASHYCDFLILMNNGKIISKGSPDAVLTKKNIAQVYHINSIVKKHPITNSIYILPFDENSLIKSKNITVHIICGGGTGSHLMHKIFNQGYTVTAGVLNELDKDYKTAKYRGIEVVSSKPFSPISDASFNENIDFIEKADIVILTSMPIGVENLKNIEAANIALKNKILIVINDIPISERDFTNGKATKYYQIFSKMQISADDICSIKVENFLNQKFKDISNLHNLHSNLRNKQGVLFVNNLEEVLPIINNNFLHES